MTDVAGAIEDEHLHRYFLAREFCRGKEVLDVASGEGYGSAILAQTALRVTGVELDAVSVEHASCAYQSANLRFIQGDATKLPLEPQSVDVVVSFETIEHLSEHEIFLAEIRRVLRPDGFLIISTPDRNVYSALGSPPNPYHVRELTEDEFCSMLGTCFCNLSLLRQRVILGSAIVSDAAGSSPVGAWVYEQRDSNTFESHDQLPRAPYLLAVASNSELPAIGASLYIEAASPAEPSREVRAELERLRGVEATAREQAPVFAKARADLESAVGDVARLTAAMQAVQGELERLRGVEAAAREQAPVFAKARADLESAVGDVARLTGAMQAMQGEQDEIVKERDKARADVDATARQLDTSIRLSRQQALVLQRFQQEARSAQQDLQASQQDLQASQQDLQVVRQDLQGVQQDLQGAREEASRYKLAYEEACSLVIPFRIRRSFPETLKRPLRAIKRVIGLPFSGVK